MNLFSRQAEQTKVRNIILFGSATLVCFIAALFFRPQTVSAACSFQLEPTGSSAPFAYSSDPTQEVYRTYNVISDERAVFYNPDGTWYSNPKFGTGPNFTFIDTCVMGSTEGLEVLGGDRRATEMWWGPEVPGKWNTVPNAPPTLGVNPDIGGGVSASSTGQHEAFQDDAMAVAINSVFKYCVGLSTPPSSPWAPFGVTYDEAGSGGLITMACNGIFAFMDGWQGSPPYDGDGDGNFAPVGGAGYWDTAVAAGTHLLSAPWNPVTKNALGQVNDTTFSFFMRNTYGIPQPNGGAFSGVMVVTLVYPPDFCLNIAGAQSSVPAGYVRDSATGNCNAEWSVGGLRVTGPSSPFTNSWLSCGNVYLNGGSPTSTNPWNYGPLTGSNTISADGSVACGTDTYTLIGYSICDSSSNPATCHNSIIYSGSVTLNPPDPESYDIWWHYAKEPKPSCGTSLTTNPAYPEEGQSFSVSYSFDLDSPAYKPMVYEVSLDAPPIYAVPPRPNPFVVGATIPIGQNWSGGPFTASGLVGPAGVYSGWFRVRGDVTLDCPFGGPTQPPPIIIGRKPYFKVFGGDVLANELIGFNNGGGGGSGVQLAAFAIGVIDGFSSATGRPSTPIGLSFANTTPPYGGYFGALAPDPDYYSFRPASPILITTAPVWVIHSGAFPPSGVFSPPPGNLTLKSPGAIPSLKNGEQKTLYVAGDLHIDDNITYQLGPWNSVSDIPSFTVIVTGNITIDSDVERLDGTYIAQFASPGGTIFTCAPGGISNPPAIDFASDCKRQLRVNGAFIARSIKLWRTIGTLSNSSNGETRASGTIAEIFNFTPELYLNKTVFPDPPKTKPEYEAITTLPPVL